MAVKISVFCDVKRAYLRWVALSCGDVYDILDIVSLLNLLGILFTI